MLRIRESDKGGDMKSSRTILTVLVFLMVVVVALTFSPKAVADTVLSESTNDWSLVLQPDTSGNSMRWLFYGRLKPGYEYDGIKDWSESGATPSDFNESDFLINYAEEKILGGMVISVGLGIIVPITIPLLCNSIPNKDVATDGELIRCAIYAYVSTDGKDMDTLKSEIASSDEYIGFYTAHNWGDEPFVVAFSELASVESDSDDDCVPDDIDNCPDVVNFDQADADLDGVGDACALAAAEEEPAELDEGVPALPQFTPPTGGYDERGGCSAVPTVPLNPSSYIIISLGLAVLAWRRRT